MRGVADLDEPAGIIGSFTDMHGKTAMMVNECVLDPSLKRQVSHMNVRVVPSPPWPSLYHFQILWRGTHRNMDNESTSEAREHSQRHSYRISMATST